MPLASGIINIREGYVKLLRYTRNVYACETNENNARLFRAAETSNFDELPPGNLISFNRMNVARVSFLVRCVSLQDSIRRSCNSQKTAADSRRSWRYLRVSLKG